MTPLFLNKTKAAEYLGVDRMWINFCLEHKILKEIDTPFFDSPRIPKKHVEALELRIERYKGADTDKELFNFFIAAREKRGKKFKKGGLK